MTSWIESHPYNLREPIPDATRLLIVGTAPPPRFSNPACGGMRGLDFDFFYGSEDNYMWQFLDEIADEIEQKRLFAKGAPCEHCCRAAREFLRRHELWMRDVLQAYRRKEGKECSASDSDIIPNQLTDFRPILELQKLVSVAFTSERAARWTFEALDEHGLAAMQECKDKLLSWKNERDYKKRFEQPLFETRNSRRKIKFFILPTPTGRSRMGLKIFDKRAIYKNLLFAQHHESNSRSDC